MVQCHSHVQHTSPLSHLISKDSIVDVHIYNEHGTLPRSKNVPKSDPPPFPSSLSSYPSSLAAPPHFSPSPPLSSSSVEWETIVELGAGESPRLAPLRRLAVGVRRGEGTKRRQGRASGG